MTSGYKTYLCHCSTGHTRFLEEMNEYIAKEDVLLEFTIFKFKIKLKENSHTEEVYDAPIDWHLGI